MACRTGLINFFKARILAFFDGVRPILCFYAVNSSELSAGGWQLFVLLFSCWVQTEISVRDSRKRESATGQGFMRMTWLGRMSWACGSDTPQWSRRAFRRILKWPCLKAIVAPLTKYWEISHGGAHLLRVVSPDHTRSSNIEFKDHQSRITIYEP
jgi:hypothetical protein